MTVESAWQQVRATLADAPSYWVCTVRPDGRPHAVPVWGVWWRHRIVFSSVGFCVKVHNLRANPNTVLHLESTTDVLVVDGVSTEVTDEVELREIGPHFDAKYGGTVGAAYDLVASQAAGMVICAVRPTVVRHWVADGTFRSLRFTFDAAGTPELAESVAVADDTVPPKPSVKR